MTNEERSILNDIQAHIRVRRSIRFVLCMVTGFAIGHVLSYFLLRFNGTTQPTWRAWFTGGVALVGVIGVAWFIFNQIRLKHLLAAYQNFLIATNSEVGSIRFLHHIDQAVAAASALGRYKK